MTVTLTLDDLTVPAPPPSSADWNDEGVVILPKFLPDELIDAYVFEWEREHGFALSADPHQAWQLESRSPGGWPDATPYMRHLALRDLCCDRELALRLLALLGEPAGVHLNLTGWVTTTRDWHQDSYLNPAHVGDYYAAVWFALGDIHPDSGPFQYVPGSHRWPQVTRDAIAQHLDITDPLWPTKSEAVLSPLFEAEIDARNAEVVTYLPRRGDVLIWHGRLLHRGSRARVEGAYRPALIAHYSGIHHRQDMPRAVRHRNAGWYFPIEGNQPVR